MLKTLVLGLERLILPPVCLVCKQLIPPTHSHKILCDLCAQRIPFNRVPFCQKCSRPVSHGNRLCHQCLRHNYAFDQAWGTTYYTGPMLKLLPLFKYHEKIALSSCWGDFLWEFFQKYCQNKHFDILMPLPLHPVRQRERGFNQALLITKELNKHLHLPISARNLRRIRHTPHQALLSQKERWTNIHGAFKITDSKEIHKKNILLIDDLLTTGATLSEAAACLKKAGANEVYCMTLAIAV